MPAEKQPMLSTPDCLDIFGAAEVALHRAEARFGNFHGDLNDFLDVLYGSEVIEATVGPDGTPLNARVKRARDGIWLGKDGTKNQQIPLVLGFCQLSAPNVLKAGVWVFPNPYAPDPDEFSVPGLPRFVARDGRLDFEPGRGLGDLLGLPDGWPRAD